MNRSKAHKIFGKSCCCYLNRTVLSLELLTFSRESLQLISQALILTSQTLYSLLKLFAFRLYSIW